MKRLYSVIITFIVGCVTLAAQNIRNHYSCDFENAEDRARWVLTPIADPSIGAQIKNKWYVGAPGNNGIGGQYGLYISDDNGATAHYTAKNCFVFAYDTITLDPLTEGDYQLSFEYRAVGNVFSNFDGLYVFWIPMTDPDDETDSIKVMSIPTSTGEVPSAYTDYKIQLQPTAGYNYAPSSSTWKSYTAKLKSSKCDGKPHYLAFAWANGALSEQQPGACVDNIDISDTRPCDEPYNFDVKLNGSHCDLTWSGDATTYEVAAYSYQENKWYGPVEVSGKSYSFGGLPVGETDFIVRTKCAEDLYSRKVIENKFVYNPDEMCVDYLDLDKANCYTGTGFGSTYTFNNYILGDPVNLGPTNPESRHVVHFDKTELEPRSGGLLKTVPEGEMASVRLGNWLNGNETERIEYSFLVDTLNYPVLLLKYAPLLEAPTHLDDENPRFTLDIMIGGVTIGSCGQADFNANNVLEGTGSNRHLRPEAAAQGWHVTPAAVAQSPGNADMIWKDWTTVGVNLKDPQYQGKKLTVRLTTYDCAFTVHCGYAYFTLGCSDGKLKGMECGRINPIFTAPDGFVYRWFYAEDEKYRQEDGKMPEAFVRGHAQEFTAGMHDDNLYAVDCMFVQDSSCFFTLYASTLATNPIPVTTHRRVGMDCEKFTYTYRFDASKSYIQEIDHVTNDTLVSTRHKIEYMEWDFGDGKHDFNKAVEHVFQAYGDRDTTYTVTLTTRYMTCEKVDTIRIHMPAVTNYTDTTVAYLCDKDIQSGQGYVWEGKRYITYTFDSVLHERQSENACDTVLYLDLRAPQRDTVNKLIFDYESTIFHGVEYNKTGVYEYVSPDCDTAAILNLRVYETLAAHLSDTMITVCSGDENAIVKYVITKGSSSYYSNKFEDAAHIKAVVREPLAVEFGAGEVSIPLPDGLYPNRYTGWLTLHDTLPEQDVVLKYMLTVNYPDTVLTQRWNDVLAVRNADYNGGYEFTTYQWYKNGIAINGATGSYLYVPEGLDFKAEYAAEVTRKSDNVKLFTCPVVPEKVSKEEISDLPTLVPRNTSLNMKGRGTARWFTALGVAVSAQDYNDSAIITPAASGSYVLHLTEEDAPAKTYHIVVW